MSVRLGRLLGGLAVLALVVGSTTWALASGASGVRVWVDQPMDDVVIVKTPVVVTAHLGDSSGVDAARLAVDGVVVATLQLGNQTLETAVFEWAPTSPGLHLLEVSGHTGGEWGSPASVVVSVGETTAPTTVIASTTTTVDEATTTSVSRSTTTTTKSMTTTTKPATSTSTPATSIPTTSTSTTTSCGLGVLSPGAVSGVNTLTPTLRWGYTGCREPDGFEIQVSRTSDFARLEWQGSTSGSSRSAQVAVGANCVTYYWRIRIYDNRVDGSWSGVSPFFVQIGRVCP